MAKNRVTRKKLLKEPDEFFTTTGKLVNWARENTRSLIWGGAAFFALVLFISFYGYFQARRANSAEVMLGRVLARYQSEIETKDAPAALAAVRSDIDTLMDTYGRLPAGRLGMLMYGHISLAGQAYDEAIGHYNAALTHFGAESSLGNIILNGLGTAYQQKGDYPKAVEHFNQMVTNASAVLKDVALFKLGVLYSQLGQVEESQNVYKQLSADFPKSMYADLVKEKMAGS